MKLFSSFLGAALPRDPAARALLDAPIVEGAGPWSPMPPRRVGGLTALGFARTDDTLLVTSASGQSVIDATTGRMIYRNRHDDGMDTAALKGTRLDHPADERIDMAGLYGGALRSATSDGWSLTQIGAAEDALCLLHPPDALAHTTRPERPAHGGDAPFHLLAREPEEIRVFGFSWTGRSLVLATPNLLRIWTRPAPLSLT